MQEPTITIVHTLEGRVRLHLSQPLMDSRLMAQDVKKHPGIHSVSYSAVTKTVLVKFDSRWIRLEEIIIRISLVLSRDYDLMPVRILPNSPERELTDSAFISAFLLAGAFFMRLLPWATGSQRVVEWIAGVGTAGAVLEHGWQDIRQAGSFHPEILSVIYLLISFIKGNFLPAAVVSWATSFGRHLISSPPQGLKFQAVETKSDELDVPAYEVNVSADRAGSTRMSLLRFLPTALMGALTGGRFDEGHLLDQVREVSQSHDQTLEGLGKLQEGISLRIS